MKLKNLKEIVRLSKWTIGKIYACYRDSDQIPLPFVIGVRTYEDEIWWTRGFRELMDIKAKRDSKHNNEKLERRKRLINLCTECQNGDDLVVKKYAALLLSKFDEPLVGVELGSAYGGNVQDIAEFWGKLGTYYGYDTFEGHPKQLGQKNVLETDCMDIWYKDPLFGRDRLDYDYQRKVLDDAGLDNAILVKGLVTDKACDNLDKIHLAFLDMDMDKSMRDGFAAVKDKIPSGGYLILHDAVPSFHLPNVYKLYKEITALPEWKLVSDNEGTYIVVFEKV